MMMMMMKEMKLTYVIVRFIIRISQMSTLAFIWIIALSRSQAFAVDIPLNFKGDIAPRRYLEIAL